MVKRYVMVFKYVLRGYILRVTGYTCYVLRVRAMWVRSRLTQYALRSTPYVDTFYVLRGYMSTCHVMCVKCYVLRFTFYVLCG